MANQLKAAQGNNSSQIDSNKVTAALQMANQLQAARISGRGLAT
jgi:hypothetical protein